jgi:hypothetical protein
MKLPLKSTAQKKLDEALEKRGLKPGQKPKKPSKKVKK